MTSRTIDKTVLERVLAHHGIAHVALEQMSKSVTLNIDSRTICAGEIFIAIRGELNDGHNYIADVIKKGASLIIADAARKNDFAHIRSLLVVNDTLQFFGELARDHLRNMGLTKIGITGSNGKTTTKEMLKAALARIVGEHAVYASVGNKNNLFGLPLCALEVKSHHRYAIFEMGMNQEGEMKRLCKIAEPDVAIITNISGAHAGNFTDGINSIRREKEEIYKACAQSFGHAVVNDDDENCLRAAAGLNFKTKTSFGHNQHATVQLTRMDKYNVRDGTQKIAVKIAEQEIEVLVPLAGAHHAMNAICSLATIFALGESVEEGARGITDMTKIDGRMTVFITKRGSLIINDGYNANPVSMKEGILASRDLPSKRRIAVIGAMGELGDKSDRLHFELGQLLAQHFDYIFVCGMLAQPTVKGAQVSGQAEDRIFFRTTSAELVDPLRALMQQGDLIFIKGSLSSQMHAVMNALI